MTLTKKPAQAVEQQYLQKLQKAFEREYIRATRQAGGVKNLRRQAESMVSIHEGDIQYLPTGGFEATLNTSEGPKYVAGVDCGTGSAGFADECRALAESINRRIRQAYEHPHPEFALGVINRIWQSAEDTCELAAARSRLLLGKLPSLKRGPVPPWFDDQVAAWDDEDSLFVSPAALRAARNIIGAISVVHPDARADVSVGMLGRVLIDWQSVSFRTRWMVEATDSCWPAVRIYEAREDEQQRFVTSIKHNMLDAIESLREVLG